MTENKRPTARLVGLAWLLIGGGIAALVVGFVVNFYDVPVVTSVLAPLGWAAIVAGITCAGLAAYRRARARDST